MLILISNLDGVIKCMLTKFVKGPKLGGEMDTSEVRATLWEDLRSGLTRTFILNSTMTTTRTCTWENIKKGLFIQDILVRRKLGMGEHHTAVAKRTKKILGCFNNNFASR